MATFLKKTLGSDTVTTSAKDDTLTVTAGNAGQAWAVAHLAIASTADYGLVSAQVGPYSWTHSTTSLASWQGTGPTDTASSVTLTFAPATAPLTPSP